MDKLIFTLAVLCVFLQGPLVNPTLLASWLQPGFLVRTPRSERLLIASLVTLGLIPIFLFYSKDTLVKGLMVLGLTIDFLIYTLKSDNAMHEELSPGYLEEKERKRHRKEVARQLRASIKGNRKLDKERQAAHLHMGGWL